MPTIDISESLINPFFNTGQRKTLRELINVVYQKTIEAIVEDPSVLGIYLDNLEDVDVPSPSDKNTLVYDSVTSTWVSGYPYAPVIFIVSGAFELTSVQAGTYAIANGTGEDPLTMQITTDEDGEWETGTEITFQQAGVFAINFEAKAGVNLFYNANLTPVSNGAYSVVGLKKIGNNAWVLYGDLVPA